MTATNASSLHDSDHLSDEELEAGGLMLLEALSFQAGPMDSFHAGHSHLAQMNQASQGAPRTQGPGGGKRDAAARTGDAEIAGPRQLGPKAEATDSYPICSL